MKIEFTCYDESIAKNYPPIPASKIIPDWYKKIPLDLDYDENYVKKGGAASDIIEPSDGFHPSQLGNELLGELLWNHLEQDFPEAIGEVNPYNDEIRKRFGDQGGF